MVKIIITSIVIATLLLGGCAGLTETQQRTLSGAAIGAAGGTLVGAIAGNAGMGAAIGTAAGATGGFLYGKHKESEKAAYDRGYQEGKKTK